MGVWRVKANKQAMATHVKFIAFPRMSSGNLCPAPNVQESEVIYGILAQDTSPRLEVEPGKLINATLKILTGYRGGLLYLEGGVNIFRFEPKTEFGNGYTSPPTVGLIETVKVGEWIAEVEYV